MEVFYCPGCQRFKAIEEGIAVEAVGFEPVRKYSNRPPTSMSEMGWRRTSQPMLLCHSCSPVRAEA
jgi:hypothetical protein